MGDHDEIAGEQAVAKHLCHEAEPPGWIRKEEEVEIPFGERDG